MIRRPFSNVFNGTMSEQRKRSSRAAGWIPGALLFLLGSTVGARSTSAEDAPPALEPTIAVHVGAFNIGRESNDGGAAIEIHGAAWGRRLWGDRLWLYPVVGIGGSANHAVLGYFGAQSDLDLPNRWRMSGGFAFTRYATHEDIDLGGPLVFRSCFTLARRTRSGVEIGASFFHVSNAHFYSNNPGANQLSLMVEIPLRPDSAAPGRR
jgi:Lipid A 3-O-deacylase (PagL)